MSGMSDYQLAQLNLAVLRAPLDAPMMAEFVMLLDPVNALADQAPGFASGDIVRAQAMSQYASDWAAMS